MMKKSLWFLMGLLFMAGWGFAQGITFEKGTWEEVLAKAKTENKVLFVDVYTSWCEPCKMMAKTVFPQEKAGEYYNRHFINYQLDGEKGGGPAVVKKYGIHGYPTFLYLDGDGKLLYRFSGAKDVEGLLEEGNKVSVCARYGGWEKMQADFKAGSKDPEFLKDFYDLADKNEKSKVLNQYLLALPDEQLFTQETGKLFEEEMTLYDYRLLTRLVEGRVKLGEKDPDFDFMFTFPLQWKLTGLFNESIETGDRNRFNELMELKRKFSVLPHSLDRDVNVIWGRGLYFATEDMLNLCYLCKNRNDDTQYKALLETYMSEIMEEYSPDSLAGYRKDTEDLIRENPGLIRLFNDQLQERHEFFAMRGLEWIDYYWRMVPSDKIHRERCAAWLNYICRMNPYNLKIPVKAAALFMRLNHKKDAISYLEKAVEMQKKVQGEHPEESPEYIRIKNQKILKELEDMVRDVRNNKV